MTVKERYGNLFDDRQIKTHLDCALGIVGYYTPQELVKWYGDCECDIESYEKDYGEGTPAIRSFLQIHSLFNYDEDIQLERVRGLMKKYHLTNSCLVECAFKKYVEDLK